MTSILLIDSSPLGERSVSRKLTAKIIADLKAKHPDSHVVIRDLGAHPLPHLDGMTIGAFFTPPDQRNAALNEAIKHSDEAIDELLAADVIVIGAPMWNFGIPSALKAWIDHVIRPGKTFQYTATGPVPLTKGKKAIIALSRGGIYSEGPMAAMDFQESYLRTILGFIGVTEINFVRAEGLAMGEEAVKTAMSKADASIDIAVAALA